MSTQFPEHLLVSPQQDGDIAPIQEEDIEAGQVLAAVKLGLDGRSVDLNQTFELVAWPDQQSGTVEITGLINAMLAQGGVEDCREFLEGLCEVLQSGEGVDEFLREHAQRFPHARLLTAEGSFDDVVSALEAQQVHSDEGWTAYVAITVFILALLASGVTGTSVWYERKQQLESERYRAICDDLMRTRNKLLNPHTVRFATLSSVLHDLKRLRGLLIDFHVFESLAKKQRVVDSAFVPEGDRDQIWARIARNVLSGEDIDLKARGSLFRETVTQMLRQMTADKQQEFAARLIETFPQLAGIPEVDAVRASTTIDKKEEKPVQPERLAQVLVVQAGEAAGEPISLEEALNQLQKKVAVTSGRHPLAVPGNRKEISEVVEALQNTIYDDRKSLGEHSVFSRSSDRIRIVQGKSHHNRYIIEYALTKTDSVLEISLDRSGDVQQVAVELRLSKVK